MKTQKIEAIKKRFHREWLLIKVDKMDEATTTPISGRLITHSPHRDEVYRRLLSLKRKWPVLVSYSEDSFPKGIIAAFSCFGITRKKFEVVCHNLPFEGPVDGLLGLNFFKDTKLILDFIKNKIEVTI